MLTQTRGMEGPKSQSVPEMIDQSHALASPRDVFQQLFYQHRGPLLGYLLAVVGDRTTAEDLFQETCLILWRDFEKFEFGTDFMSWAKQVAFNRIRAARRRRRMVSFSEETMTKIAETQDRLSLSSDSRWGDFQDCLTQLSNKDRELIDEYYAQEATAEELSEQSGRTVAAIRYSIKRVRKLLFACMESKRND